MPRSVIRPVTRRAGDMSNAGLAAGEPGAARDIVVLNAAAGLLTAGHSATPEEAAQLATEAIDRGAAAELLARLAQLSHEPVS